VRSPQNNSFRAHTRKTGAAVGEGCVEDFSPSYPPQFRIDNGARDGVGRALVLPLHTTSSGQGGLPSRRTCTITSARCAEIISFRAHASKTGAAVGEGGVEDFSPLISSPLFVLMPACVTGRTGLARVAPFTSNPDSTTLLWPGRSGKSIFFLRPCAGLDLPTSRGPRDDLPADRPSWPDADVAGRCYGLRCFPGRGLPSIRTRHAGLSRFARRDSFGHPLACAAGGSELFFFDHAAGLNHWGSSRRRRDFGDASAWIISATNCVAAVMA
jgi:hypothetical protein